MITLYHYYRSSCSWRVRLALALKNVPYKAIAVNLLEGEQQNPDFLAKNPAGFVPAIVHEGQTYAESIAIIEWLEERYPTPALLPQSPEEKMLCRQLAQIVVSQIQPLQNPYAIKFHYADEEMRKHAIKHWIHRGLGVYEKLLQNIPSGTFSLGSQITLADICLIPQVYNAYRFEIDMQEFPRVDRIYHNALTLPACKESHPEVFQKDNPTKK